MYAAKSAMSVPYVKSLRDGGASHLMAIAMNFKFRRALMANLLTLMLGYAFATPNLQLQTDVYEGKSRQ